MVQLHRPNLIFILTILESSEAEESSEVEEDPDAKKMTVEQFVELVKVLEAGFPDIPSNELIHKLRMLVTRYDSTVWKVRNTFCYDFFKLQSCFSYFGFGILLD